MVEQRIVDRLLDKHSRLVKALQVLHLESDTDLPFTDWVDLVAMRHLTWVNHLEHRDDHEVKLPERVCPVDGCVAAYTRSGERRVLGKDSNGKVVFFQRWECANGHWHTIPEEEDARG
jgi:hypothetical protein